MNYNKLKVFYEVAQTRNQSRAAEELYMSQSTLSKHILDLEADFNAKLFLRTNRDMVLTPAGEELLTYCNTIFPREAEVYRRVWEASAREIGTLHVAIMGINIAYRMPELSRRFSAAYPDIRPEFIRLNWRKVLHAVDAGEAEVGIKLALEESYPEHISFHTIANAPLGVVLPKDHPMAGRPSLRLEEMKDEPFLFLSKHDSLIPHDNSLKMCRQAGFAPRIAGTYPNSETLLLMVQTGAGIAILSRFAPMHGVEGIVCVDIEDAPVVSMDVIWRNDFTNNAIQLFVDMIRQLERE